jgi:hypothetical protein
MRFLLLAALITVVACGSAPGNGCARPPAATAGTPVNCIGGSLATDAPTYSPGATVTIRETATNTCMTPVAVPVACGAPLLTATASDGRIVWRTIQMGIACPALARLMQPGESVTYTQSWPTASDTPPGVYKISGPPEYGSYWVAVC